MKVRGQFENILDFNDLRRAASFAKLPSFQLWKAHYSGHSPANFGDFPAGRDSFQDSKAISVQRLLGPGGNLFDIWVATACV